MKSCFRPFLHPDESQDLTADPKSSLGCKNMDIAILSYGGRLAEALKAAEALEAQGKSVTVADAIFAKPLDTALIARLVDTHHTLITIEEGSSGGFGAHILEHLANADLLGGGCKIKTMHLPDTFQDQDTPDKQYEEAGLDVKGILGIK